jgi:putative chitinase
MITGDLLRQLDCVNSDTWAPLIEAASQKHGITTRLRVAGFLGNIVNESGNLKAVSENMNYSVDGLLATFKNPERLTPAQAQQLGRKPGEPALNEARQKAIAMQVYGGAWGLKNLGNRLNTDDPWDCRGGGLIQLTGFGNWKRFADKIGVTFEALKLAIRTQQGAAESAAHFWQVAGCNTLSDAQNFTGARRVVAFGHDDGSSTPLGLNNVLAITRKVLQLLP